MTELTQTLTELATHNYSGAPVLGAYGLNWLVCAFVWRRFNMKTAAFVTLFQGMVALPIALGVSASLGMFVDRPGTEIITQLSILVSLSQLLVLPLLIVFTMKKNFTAVPLFFSLAGAIHFIPYAWLYQTPLYIVMSTVLAVSLAVLYAMDKDKPKEQLMSRRGAGLVCAVTGMLLFVTGMIFII